MICISIETKLLFSSLSIIVISFILVNKAYSNKTKTRKAVNSVKDFPIYLYFLKNPGTLTEIISWQSFGFSKFRKSSRDCYTRNLSWDSQGYHELNKFHGASKKRENW